MLIRLLILVNNLAYLNKNYYRCSTRSQYCTWTQDHSTYCTWRHAHSTAHEHKITIPYLNTRSQYCIWTQSHNTAHEHKLISTYPTIFVYCTCICKPVQTQVHIRTLWGFNCGSNFKFIWSVMKFKINIDLSKKICFNLIWSSGLYFTAHN